MGMGNTGRVCLRSSGFAGPKSQKSDHQTYFNLKLVKINKFHNGKNENGRVCLRLAASAGPKSRKSHSLASLIHHSRNLKITKFHLGRRTPAGSVSALRASQGQSRKKMITSPLLIKNSQNKQISYGNGEHRPGLTPPYGLRRAKVAKK